MVELAFLSNRVGGNNINISFFLKFVLSYSDHFPCNVQMLTADVSYDYSVITGDAVLCFSGVFQLLLIINSLVSDLFQDPTGDRMASCATIHFTRIASDVNVRHWEL
jgi:hypothetical protein